MPGPDDKSQYLTNLLDFQIGPSLLLSSSRKIIAVNQSGLRLICGALSDNASEFSNELVGQAISNLEIILTPGCKPVYRDWNAIFDAVQKQRQDSGRGHVTTDSPESSSTDESLDGTEDEEIRRTRYAKRLAADTKQFWDDEHQRQPPNAESDVIVLSQKLGINRREDANRDASRTPQSIKARMTVSLILQLESPIYLILFRQSVENTASTLNDAKDYAGFIKPIRHENITSSIIEKDGQHSEGDSASRTAAEHDLSTPEDVEIQNQLIPHIMAILSPEGQAMCFSDSWFQFTGLTEEESIGTGWAAVIHPDDVKSVTESWANVIRGDVGHWTWEVRYRRADGVYIWFIIRAQPYKDKSGKTLRWYASMLDINSWVQARVQSDHRNDSMLKLLSQADISLWGINQRRELYIREGHLDWDPTMVIDVFERRGSHSSGHDGSQAGKKTQYQRLAKVICAALQGEKIPPAIEHEEGDRHFRTRFVADMRSRQDVDQEGTTDAVLALTYEITDIKKRAMLELDNERLAMNEKAAKDASNLKSSFLANMSHEIRTPIAGIIGLSEHLADLKLSKDQQDFCDNIRDSAKFLLSLVNDVLDFSKIESGHMDIEAVVFAPLKIVHDIFAVMNQQAHEKGLSLDLFTNLPQDTLVVGDPGRIRQILTNLIGNSIKFTNDGFVSLTIECVDAGLSTPKDERMLDLRLEGSTGSDSRTVNTSDHRMNVRFIVRDSGIGIDVEAMKNLFKPFSQADTSTARTYGGSGLGLMICRQLVGLMEGQIALESTVGSGTVAMFTIPFYEYDGRQHPHDLEETDEASPMESPSTSTMDWTSPYREQEAIEPQIPIARTDSRRFGSPRRLHLRNASQRKLSPEERARLFILVVEDNPVNRKIISLSVSKLGFDVAAVCNGQEALDYLSRQSSQRRPDAILMDCMMPICDGYQATFRLRHDEETFDDDMRDVPVIALTASAIKGDRERCHDAGMDDYLKKPVARDTLERSLLKWLTARRKASVSSSIA